MIFSKVFKTNPIQKFDISVAKGENNNTVAFGPASIINGCVTLFLNKPIRAKKISVVFKCEEKEGKNERTTLFSVDSPIWEPKEEKDNSLETGNHMYLFAIQLPASVNYPPSISKDYLGYQIEYSLQGFLDHYTNNNGHSSATEEKATSKIALTYLPLVTYNDSMNAQYAQRSSRTIKIEKEHDYVEVTASLANPSSCPGDLCSIKLRTNNHSSFSIHQVRIILLCTATTLDTKSNATYGSPSTSANANYPELPSSSGPRYQRKQHQLLNETFYVTIPKHATHVTSVCPFRVPSYCVPTTQSHYGKHFEISYEVFVVIPAMGHRLETYDNIAQLLINPQQQVIRLPLFISTIPYYSNPTVPQASSTIPVITPSMNNTTANITTALPRLQIPFANNNNGQSNTDAPTFIIHESPLPSPSAHSPSGGSYCNWSPGSPVAEGPARNSFDDTLVVPAHGPVEDATGHLMVPPISGGGSSGCPTPQSATTLRRSPSSQSVTSFA